MVWSTFLSISKTVLTFAILEVEFLHIFKFNRVVPEFDLFTLKISATTGTQFLLAWFTNKIFQKFAILAIQTQIWTTFLAKLDLKAGKQSSEARLLDLGLRGFRTARTNDFNVWFFPIIVKLIAGYQKILLELVRNLFAGDHFLCWVLVLEI